MADSGGSEGGLARVRDKLQTHGFGSLRTAFDAAGAKRTLMPKHCG